MTVAEPHAAQMYPFDPEDHAGDNTPDATGYFLAVLVSWALISVGSLVGSAVLEDGFDVLRVVTLEELVFDLIVLLTWSVVVGFLGALTAPFGVAAVHLACLKIANQWVHVLAAGVVGGLAVYAVALVFGEPPRDWDKMAAGVGFCTAIGRAAVIPLVPVVRQRRGAVQPPVDGDFRPSRTAC